MSWGYFSVYRVKKLERRKTIHYVVRMMMIDAFGERRWKKDGERKGREIHRLTIILALPLFLLVNSI